MKIWTIGHSTRVIDDFIAALEGHGIKALVDVRTLPGSRRYPQFNKEALAASLAECGIRYEHFPELGGRRKAKPDSNNTAWRNASFRGYADYMETEDFRRGIQRLVDLAEETGATVRAASSTRGVAGVAIMCAEAVWWRCHRGLISDFLKARGVEVIHIIDDKRSEPHPFTSAAKIINGELSYTEEPLFTL